MPKLTSEEMLEIQKAMQEAYEFVALPFAVLRVDEVNTTVDKLYGEASKPKYATTWLDGSVLVKPSKKELTKFGLEEEVDVLINVTREELRAKSFEVLSTDNIKFNGQTYRIEKLTYDGVLPLDDGTVDGTTDYLSLNILANTE